MNLMRKNFIYLKKTVFLYFQRPNRFVVGPFHENIAFSSIMPTLYAENDNDVQRKNENFIKIKFLRIRSTIMFILPTYHDPGSNLSLQTFVHKILLSNFSGVLIFDDFSYFPDSFW